MNNLREQEEIRDDYDVVVVGAGAAGLVAANAASEGEARVLLVEKLTTPGGTLPYAAGLLFHDDPSRDPIVPAYNPRPSAVVSRDFTPAAEWLSERGVQLGELLAKHGGAYRIEPNPVAGAVEPLLQRFRDAGGAFLAPYTVESIVLASDGAVGGVKLKGNSRVIGTRAVILATGGFQGDPDLVTRYIAPWERVLWRANRGTTGDGFRMGLAAGAAASAGLGAFVGHLSPSDGIRPLPLEPERFRPATLACIKDVVLLNLEGRRFADESRMDVPLVNALAKDRGGVGIVVFDSVVKEEYAKQRAPEPGDDRTAFEQWRDLGARVESADTLSELFARLGDLGLPRDVATATLEEYDRAAQAGDDDGLPVRRRSRLHRCTVAPFYAMLVCPDITYTEGGLRVDDDGRALDRDGRAVAGLYAAGETAGLVALASQAGGLATAITTGWRAGEHASSYVRRSRPLVN